MKSTLQNTRFWYAVLFLGFTAILSLMILTIYKMYTCPKNYVCLPKKVFKDVLKGNQPHHHHHMKHKHMQKHKSAEIRDRQVLSDPLYPPLNRTDKRTFENVVEETNRRNINIPTNDVGDTYRLVGYVISKDQQKDAGGNNWKLMARQKDRNESDFYMIPTNRDYDVKVPLTPEVFVGQRLKDVYTIPKDLQFNSPLLNKTSYEFVELPKTNFADSYN